MMADGKLCVTAEKSRSGRKPALDVFGPVAPHLWIIDLSTGATRVIRSADYEDLPAGWALLMTGPEPLWVAQWDGDWQRACDEQLNPLLAEVVV